MKNGDGNGKEWNGFQHVRYKNGTEAKEEGRMRTKEKTD
jgi:hypothetical protein